MKKTYIQPQSLSIRFSMKESVLQATSPVIGVKNDSTWGGSNACSNQKELDSNGMWSGMED